jgi:effector-binding domain-containing protein
MLEQRRSELEGQIEKDRARLVDVERRLRLMEGDNAMELEFTEKALPELTLSQVVGHVKDVEDIGPRVGPMFEELVEKVVAAGKQPTHPGYAWYAGRDGGLDLGAGFEIADVPGTEVGVLEAVPRAVTTVYRGSMAHIGEAWQALGAHIQQRGLEFAGPCREVYLHTEDVDQDTWVTELQQPVS